MPYRRLLYRLLPLLGLMLVASNAAAHRVDISLRPQGDALHGHAHYADGSPVANAAVDVVDNYGNVLATIRTDTDGEFTYTPTSAQVHAFVVTTDDGHRAEIHVETSEVRNTENMPRAPFNGGDLEGEMRRAVQEELAPLHRQIDAYQRQVRFHDLLGGIGYIVGVVGLFAWWKARGRQGQS